MSRSWCGSPLLTGIDAERLDDVVGYLLGQQLDDGGWNCAARGDPGKHSSFHTSILALEALDAYQRAGGGAATEEAQARGREFFLRHQLYKSHRTGQVAIRGSTRFPQLPQWHFDVLRGLEHFADVGAAPGRTARRRCRRGAACPSSRRPMADLRRLSRPYMVPDGGTGSEPVEHAYECCASWIGGTQPAELLAATCHTCPVRDVVILGSTGSIGTQSLEVVAEHPDQFRVVGLAAGGSQIPLLAQQALDTGAHAVAVSRATTVQDLQLALYAEASRRGWAQR